MLRDNYCLFSINYKRILYVDNSLPILTSTSSSSGLFGMIEVGANAFLIGNNDVSSKLTSVAPLCVVQLEQAPTNRGRLAEK